MSEKTTEFSRARKMQLSYGIPHSILLLALIQVFFPSCHQFSCHGFSTRATASSTPGGIQTSSNNNINNILILDHINMNHGKGRHDWLKSFYGTDFLGCAWDPRKAKNLETGRKTVWANLGAQQFHLPEGSPNAQVLDGVITIVHPSPETLLERYASIQDDASCLYSNDSLFHVVVEDGDSDADNGADADTVLIVTDPWGSVFRIVKEGDRDPRGSQPGEVSEGSAISDLTIHVPMDANLEGIGRFYEEILGAKLATPTTVDDDETVQNIQIEMGPFQTLTFLPKESVGVDTHVDLREMEDDNDNDDDDDATMSSGTSTTLENYGVHISLYVADLPTSYQKAHDLGLAYVNTRFSRRAYNLEEAVNDCMFRCLDIVDPLNPQDGPILRLEHEVRSVVKKDGSKYKSCPFETIPDVCVTV
jgi:hypothetical protein